MAQRAPRIRVGLMAAACLVTAACERVTAEDAPGPIARPAGPASPLIPVPVGAQPFVPEPGTPPGSTSVFNPFPGGLFGPGAPELSRPPEVFAPTQPRVPGASPPAGFPGRGAGFPEAAIPESGGAGAQTGSAGGLGGAGGVGGPTPGPGLVPGTSPGDELGAGPQGGVAAAQGSGGEAQGSAGAPAVDPDPVLPQANAGPLAEPCLAAVQDDGGVLAVMLEANRSAIVEAEIAARHAGTGFVRAFAERMLETHEEGSRLNEGLAVAGLPAPEDSAMTEALRAESLAAEQALEEERFFGLDPLYLDRQIGALAHRLALTEQVLIPLAEDEALTGALTAERGRTILLLDEALLVRWALLTAPRSPLPALAALGLTDSLGGPEAIAEAAGEERVAQPLLLHTEGQLAALLREVHQAMAQEAGFSAQQATRDYVRLFAFGAALEHGRAMSADAQLLTSLLGFEEQVSPLSRGLRADSEQVLVALRRRSGDALDRVAMDRLVALSRLAVRILDAHDALLITPAFGERVAVSRQMLLARLDEALDVRAALACELRDPRP